MATTGFSFEAEAVEDACDDVACVFQALARRHGQPFRDLERDIRMMCEGWERDGSPPLGFEYLGDGAFAVVPPAPLSELLRRARQMGVI